MRKKNVTIGDCAEALAKIEQEKGYRYKPSDKEILDEAIRDKSKPWFETFNEWAVDNLGMLPNLFFKMCIIILVLIELYSEASYKPWMKYVIMTLGLLWLYQDMAPFFRGLDICKQSKKKY